MQCKVHFVLVCFACYFYLCFSNDYEKGDFIVNEQEKANYPNNSND